MRAHIVVALGVLMRAAVAAADPEATRLFEEGRALLERGKPDEACRRFARSLERERAGGTMLNLAACAERAGRLTRAWSLYGEAAREYERANKAAAMKFARGRAAALEPKLAIVIVRVADPDLAGLVVQIGGEAVPPGSRISRFHDPGPVTIAARAPGRARWKTTATGIAGERVVVEVPVLAPREARPAPRDRAPAEPRSRPWRVAFWTSLGAGALGGGVALYGWRQIADAEDRLCPGGLFGCGTVPADERDRYIRQGERGETLTWIGAGVIAASAVAAGITAYLAFGRGDGSGGRGATAFAVAPVLSPSAAGIALRAGF